MKKTNCSKIFCLQRKLHLTQFNSIQHLSVGLTPTGAWTFAERGKSASIKKHTAAREPWKV